MSADPKQANTASLSEMRVANQTQGSALAVAADQTVDMFSERGFQLAQRIGKAFATSDAVPAQFRLQVLKKERGGAAQWVENPAAIGNCLVAIETARAVGMSITAVMQQANVIEGRLTWSGKFVIAAINASGRFTPLRFQIKNLGVIKAKYREKQGWNKDKGGFDFKDITVEVENVQCIAWALPKGFHEPRVSAEQLREYMGRQLDLYRALGLPVIESAPVSIKMAVEEGWYGKSGSKWQTEMAHLMLQYRSGSFFGNIHAPDIVMGMGRTTEEVADTGVLDMNADGTVVVPLEELRRAPAPAANSQGVTDVVQKNSTEPTDEPHPETGEVAAPAQAPAQAAAQEAAGFNVNAFADKLGAAKTQDELDAIFDTMRAQGVSDEQRDVLSDVYQTRANEIEAAKAATPAPASRRGRSATPSVE